MGYYSGVRLTLVEKVRGWFRRVAHKLTSRD